MENGNLEIYTHAVAMKKKMLMRTIKKILKKQQKTALGN